MDVVLKELQRVFKNNTPIVQSLKPQYNDEYSAYGAEAGESIRIKVPQRYEATEGKTANVQNRVEESVTLTRATQYNVVLKFSLKELSLDIGEFSRRHLIPAATTLASKVEAKVGDVMYKGATNVVALPTTALDKADILNAGVMLDNMSAPRDNERYLVLNPQGQADVVSDLSGLFQKSDAIGKQYMTGQMGTALGFNFAMSQNLPTHTTGSYDGAYAVNGAPTEGSNTLAVDTGTGTFTVGDAFTIADVNSVNRVTGDDTGKEQVFIVQTASAGGGVNLTVEPDFTTSGAQKKITALPADDAATTEIGTKSTAYPQNLAFHASSTAFGTVDLELPGNSNFEGRMVENGISMRIYKFLDGKNDDNYYRVDVLTGAVVVVPGWIARIYGL